MYTIGHSTLPIKTFIEILEYNKISTLVDVRSFPSSRYNPQFGKEKLWAAVEWFGISYHWLPVLGGRRPKPKKESINLAWKNLSFRNFADYMQTKEFDAGIKELLDIPGKRVAIMCAEAVPWRCHRSMVADALVVRGIKVRNILYDNNGNSSLKKHELRDFAKVDGTRVWYPEADRDE